MPGFAEDLFSVPPADLFLTYVCPRYMCPLLGFVSPLQGIVNIAFHFVGPPCEKNMVGNGRM